MSYAFLADLVFLVHFSFILFVIFGGLIVFKKPKFAWIHIPMVLWAAIVNWISWVCPLTPLENYLRMAAGQAGYESGFLQHYLVPVIYPQGMSYETGILLGVTVFVWNVLLYALIFYKRHKAGHET